MPVTTTNRKTVQDSGGKALVIQVDAGYSVVTRSFWTAAELEELGIAIATLVNKVLTPVAIGP